MISKIKKEDNNATMAQNTQWLCVKTHNRCVLKHTVDYDYFYRVHRKGDYLNIGVGGV